MRDEGCVVCLCGAIDDDEGCLPMLWSALKPCAQGRASAQGEDTILHHECLSLRKPSWEREAVTLRRSGAEGIATG
jgi:hypothetical protein